MTCETSTAPLPRSASQPESGGRFGRAAPSATTDDIAHSAEAPGFVIAVSGTSGAGKSTVIEHAAEAIGPVTRLHFDDYITLGLDIAEILGWLAEGADPNAIATPELAADLARLRGGGTAHPPSAAAPVASARLIVLEEPFGRARSEIAQHVDFAVHLDLPGDIAMARRLLRRIREIEDDAAAHHHSVALAEIENQLGAFLAAGRGAYAAAEAAAREAAHLVLDARDPPEMLAKRLITAIEGRLRVPKR